MELSEELNFIIEKSPVVRVMLREWRAAKNIYENKKEWSEWSHYCFLEDYLERRIESEEEWRNDEEAVRLMKATLKKVREDLDGKEKQFKENYDCYRSYEKKLTKRIEQTRELIEKDQLSGVK